MPPEPVSLIAALFGIGAAVSGETAGRLPVEVSATAAAVRLPPAAAGRAAPRRAAVRAGGPHAQQHESGRGGHQQGGRQQGRRRLGHLGLRVRGKGASHARRVAGRTFDSDASRPRV